MASSEDRKAARVLVKRKILTEEEAAEFLEAVDEIEPEGGLLGLLEEEGRITAKDASAVRREAAKRVGGTTVQRRSESARPEKGHTRLRRREEPEEEAPAPGRGEARRPAEKTRVRRKASEEAPAAGKGGKGKILVLGAAGLVVAIGAVAVVLALMGTGPAGDGDSDSGSIHEDGATPEAGGTGEGSVEPGATGSKGAPPKKAPEIPPFTAQYRFKSGMRVNYFSGSETTDSSGKEKVHAKKDVNEFISFLGDTSEGQKVCILRQVTEQRTTGNKSTERFPPSNKSNFLVLTPEGQVSGEASGGADELLWILANPVFPPGGRIEGGTWTLERESKEGRFEVQYTVQARNDPQEVPEQGARSCLRIGVEARFPGGAPPSFFRLDRAAGTVWFDPEFGVVVRCEAFLDTSDATLPSEAEPQVRRSIRRTLSARYDLGSDEMTDVKYAADLYFGVLELVENRKYAKAQATLDAAVDGGDIAAEYLQGDFVPNLKASIPEVRMSQQAGVAMRDRQTTRFLNLPWRREDRPPAMLTGSTPRREGKRRVLDDLVGKAAPGWLSELCRGGTKSFVYFVMGSFEASRSAARLASELHNKFKSGIATQGVLLEGEQRKVFEFIFSVGGVNHPMKNDGNSKALAEGGLKGVPAFFVVDASGKVLHAEIGYCGAATKEALEKALR